MFLIPNSPSVVDIKSSRRLKLVTAQTLRLAVSSLFETRLVRRQLRRIDRQQMLLENEGDDQKRRGQEASYRAPQPGPERQRQQHGEPVQREAASDDGRRDKMPFQESDSGKNQRR